MGAAQAKKQINHVEYDMQDFDEIRISRGPSSARKYIQPVKQKTQEGPALEESPFIHRRSSAGTHTTSGMASKAISPPKTEGWDWHKYKHFPLLAVLVGMLAMAALVLALSAFGSWWQVHQDDVTYGRPRTFQVDAVVGHSDSAANPSHFIFINLNRHVEIIEFPGGDATHARIYTGPILFGNGQDLTPVTAEFRDVNGDGRPDMIVHIQDQRIIYINDGTQFRPLQPGEHVNLGPGN